MTKPPDDLSLEGSEPRDAAGFAAETDAEVPGTAVVCSRAEETGVVTLGYELGADLPDVRPGLVVEALKGSGMIIAAAEITPRKLSFMVDPHKADHMHGLIQERLRREIGEKIPDVEFQSVDPDE